MRNQIQPYCLRWQDELEKSLLVLWGRSRLLKKEDFLSIQNGIIMSKNTTNCREFLYNPVHASQHLSIDLLLSHLGQYKGKMDILFAA